MVDQGFKTDHRSDLKVHAFPTNYVSLMIHFLIITLMILIFHVDEALADPWSPTTAEVRPSPIFSSLQAVLKQQELKSYKLEEFKTDFVGQTAPFEDIWSLTQRRWIPDCCLPWCWGARIWHHPRRSFSSHLTTMHCPTGPLVLSVMSRFT